MGTQMSTGKADHQPLARRTEDPFDAMRREMDYLFDSWGNGGLSWPRPFSLSRHHEFSAPDMDVKETDKEFLIEAELPGVDEKDVSITLANGMLTLKGEKKQERDEKKDNYYLVERSYGSFQRALRLPETADDSKVEAKFANGVLKIAIAKHAEAVKPERKIEIKKA